MIKFLIGVLLNLILGSLKTIAFKHVQNLNVDTLLSGPEKRKAAFDAIQADFKAEGKNIRDSLVNLVIELIVTYLKKKAT